MYHNCPELSILVATHNGRKYLREAITSLLEENLASFEILVVDDGSDDGSLETISDLPVRLLRSDCRRGTAVVYNEALPMARGEFLAFFDHDDLLAPGSLIRRLEWLKAHPSQDISLSALKAIPASTTKNRC